MSSIDWKSVGNETIAAVRGVLQNNWSIVSGPASAQIQALTTVAMGLERDHANGKLDEDDYAVARAMQKNALEGILLAHKTIGIVTAEQAADAAWAVVSKALGTVIPFAI